MRQMGSMAGGMVVLGIMVWALAEGEYAESWETRERAKERLRPPTTRFVGQGVVPVQMRC